MKTLRRNSTGANRGNGGRNQNLCSLCFLLFESGPGGVVKLDFDKSISDGVNMNPESFRGDFVLRARDNASPYIDNIACLPSIGLAEEGANTKPSMSKATPRLVCSATRSW